MASAKDDAEAQNVQAKFDSSIVEDAQAATAAKVSRSHCVEALSNSSGMVSLLLDGRDHDEF